MSAAVVVRHRPGPGLVLGLAGVGALILSLLMLPWVSEGGREVMFANIRDHYAATDDLIYPPLDPGGSPDPSGGSSTPGPSLSPGDSLPPSGPEQPTLVPAVSSQPAPSAEYTEENVYLELYTAWGWVVVLVVASLAVLFTTVWVPSGKSGRMATGFLTAGLLGLLVNLADDEGRVGPRISGTLAALGATVIHGFAVWALFGDELAPDPAPGVWIGVLGLVAVLAGCLVGTRTRRVTAADR